MREIFHFSLASHQEVMYRNEADFNHGFNCLAEASLETESSLLAEGFLSTHFHGLAFTDRVKELIRIDRYSYTRYFNAKYERRGRLGERSVFTLPIDGLYHITVALNYVLRQGLHHGITATPFGYPHCSANAFFRKDLGRTSPEMLMPSELRYKFLPDRSSVPTGYRMNASGLLLREDILDISHVEKIYVSPRNFLFQMNRISDQKWIDEQKADKTKTPDITLALIETGVKELDVAECLRNEHGSVNSNRLTDMELCQIIDKDYLPRLTRSQDLTPSVYSLTRTQRNDLGNKLWKAIPLAYKKTVTIPQLRRCLCTEYPFTD